MNEILANIKTTVEGYDVKNLRFLPLDNIIVGQVKDPVWGKPELHDGFIAGQWKATGTPTNKIKGRNDLKLDIPNDNSKDDTV